MSALSASDRQHRMVIAAAARYDNHPQRVIPTSPVQQHRVVSNSQSNCSSKQQAISQSYYPNQRSVSPRQHQQQQQQQQRAQEEVETSSDRQLRISPIREQQVLEQSGKGKSSEEVQQRFNSGRNKMERGISKASENEYIIHQARTHVESQFQGSPDSPDCPGGSGNNVFATITKDFIDTPIYTFTLPDLTSYPEDFRSFLEKDLIELSSLISLEQSGRLNWWSETGTCQRLWPLATSGDGNCLLHAASLGMWGFHDRLLTLRKALHSFLSSSTSASSIYRRWRWQCHVQNLQYGLQLSEKEWQDEWKSVLRLASSEPRHGSSSSSSDTSFMSSSSSTSSTASSHDNQQQQQKSRRWSRMMTVAAEGGGATFVGEGHQSGSQPLYESLEEIHVLALAHVLRRPIIVVADTVLRDMNGEALAPIPFGGVYLPLEIPSSACHRSPLLLTYNAGHFSALVSMQSDRSDEYAWLPAVIPLTDSNHDLLPLQFVIDPGENFVWNRDEFNEDITSNMTLHPNGHLNLLNSYLEVVKVTLPDWVFENAAEPNLVNNNNNRHKSKPVIKGFGSIGKKLKKNLGRLARNGSFKNNTSRNNHMVSEVDVRPSSSCSNSGRIVSPNQTFILSAFIHTNQTLPFQNEMLENYLEEARERFEAEKDLKRKKLDEQAELEEKRKRDIYLNGGFIDCITPNCIGQGTLATNYLCKMCYDDAKRSSSPHTSPMSLEDLKIGNSKFYVPTTSSSSTMSNDDIDSVAFSKLAVQESVASKSSNVMTVKLPPPSSDFAFKATQSTCRNVGCDFFGTSKFDGFCSKCYSLKRR